MKNKQILMVVTSQTKMSENRKTGLWLEEFTVSYNLFKNKGYGVKVISIPGGEIEPDPRSIPEEQIEEWKVAEEELKSTAKLSKDDAYGFDAVYIPGGYGAMFDLPDNETLRYVLQQFAEDNRVIGSVCHGPAALVNVTYKDGTPIVKGKKINALTDSEEKLAGTDQHMPFLLESKLREKGADFVRGDDRTDFSVRDGNLVTGRNPRSARSTAEKVIEALES